MHTDSSIPIQFYENLSSDFPGNRLKIHVLVHGHLLYVGNCNLSHVMKIFNSYFQQNL